MNNGQRDFGVIADKMEITEVLYRYAKGVDTFDGELTASCFADDASFVIGDEVITGRKQLAGYFNNETGTRKQQTGLDPVEIFTHVMANALIDVDGDTALAESIVTAYVIGLRAGVRTMLVRSVRYRDDFVRQDGEWCISSRDHVLQWMYETEPSAISAH